VEIVGSVGDFFFLAQSVMLGNEDDLVIYLELVHDLVPPASEVFRLIQSVYHRFPGPSSGSSSGCTLAVNYIQNQSKRHKKSEKHCVWTDGRSC
jgi:hypothetical protein